jgi:hypothetical protein
MKGASNLRLRGIMKAYQNDIDLEKVGRSPLEILEERKKIREQVLDEEIQFLKHSNFPITQNKAER